MSTQTAEHKGWIGVDLDGTLAHYDGWKGVEHIGAPIPKMLQRVKTMLVQGKEVRIFTARCHDGQQRTIDIIQDWCEQHIGQRLPVTNVKDFAMVTLFDDRCVQVEANTGDTLEDKLWRIENKADIAAFHRISPRQG